VKQNCIFIFFFRAQSHTIIYTLSLHDALPISDRSETDERSESPRIQRDAEIRVAEDRDQRRREVEEGEIGTRDGVEPQERRHLRPEEQHAEGDAEVGERGDAEERAGVRVRRALHGVHANVIVSRSTDAVTSSVRTSFTGTSSVALPQMPRWRSGGSTVTVAVASSRLAVLPCRPRMRAIMSRKRSPSPSGRAAPGTRPERRGACGGAN